MNFDGHAIANATGGELLQDGLSGPIVTDTRKLGPGAWFLALVGERFDGHDFLSAALDVGAAGVVISRALPDGWPLGAVRVADTTRAYQDLGHAARDGLDGVVVGLTGTTGKTTTRAMIALALEALGPVHQTVANLNNHIGVPLTLLAAPQHAAASVVEMGTSSRGEIEVLERIATPDIRLVLNVGPGHLEELGGLDGVATEKAALVRRARAGDVVVLNADDARVASMAVGASTQVLTYGWAEGADVRLLRAEVDPVTMVTEAEWLTPEGAVGATLPVAGVHFAHNAAAAIAVSLAAGVSTHEAASRLEAYAPVGMRQRVEELPGGVVAINDTYNANPVSMEAALRMLAGLEGRRVAVLGDMLELGAEEARFHRDIVALAGGLGLDAVALVGERMHAASEACGAAVLFTAPNGQQVVPQLRAWLRPGDRVLFKGSRGAKVERILQSLRED